MATSKVRARSDRVERNGCLGVPRRNNGMAALGCARTRNARKDWNKEPRDLSKLDAWCRLPANCPPQRALQAYPMAAQESQLLLSRLKLQELTPAYVGGATILAASETVIITVSGSTGEATKPYFS